MCLLAQGHNAVTPARLKPAIPRYRDKRSVVATALPFYKHLDQILHVSQFFQRGFKFDVFLFFILVDE